MKLKHVFSILLALPLAAAAAQPTNLPVPPQPPLPPMPGRSTAPAANSASNVPPARRNTPAAASAASFAAADPSFPEVANLEYNLTMPVDQLLDEIYAPLVGRTPIRAPAVNKDTIITLKTVKEHPLTRREAIMALETILGLNNITIVNIGDKFFKVVPSPDAAGAGGVSVTNSASSLSDAGKFITEIVQLKYADPDQVVKALGYFAKSANSIIYIPSTESLILRDYTENVKRMLEMVEQLDVESPLTIKSEVIPIRYALAEDISSCLGQLGAGSGTMGKSTSGASFKASTGTGTTGTGGATTGTSYPGQPNSSSLSAGASGARSSLGTRLNNIVSGAAGTPGAVPSISSVKPKSSPTNAPIPSWSSPTTKT